MPVKAGQRSGWSRTPLLGLSKDRPSIDIRTECPLPTAIRFRLRPRRAPALAVADLLPEGRRPALRCLRPEAATLRTRSALVVPPDFGGLLHSVPCRSVAPCSQSWGSPRFRAEVRPRVMTAFPKEPQRHPAPHTRAIPEAHPPFGAFPLPAAMPRHRGPCPLAVEHGHTPGDLPRTEGHAPARPGALDLKALLHRKVRCAARSLPTSRRSMLPWASRPTGEPPSVHPRLAGATCRDAEASRTGCTVATTHRPARAGPTRTSREWGNHAR